MRIWAINMADDYLHESCYEYLQEFLGEQIKKEGSLLLYSDENNAFALDTISYALADFIIEEWEKDQLWQLVFDCFDDFSLGERYQLIKKSEELLNADSLGWGAFSGKDRKDKLTELLKECFSQWGIINFDGLILFRLLGYEEYLLAILSAAADEFWGERDDGEFIRLLRHFLLQRESMAEKVHLLFLSGGAYNIYIEEKKHLRILEGGKEEGYEDILITVLLLLSPKKLVCHWEKGSSAGKSQKLIKKIFSSRLIVCPGCSLCDDQCLDDRGDC
ncbi:MAG: sporulation protein YtxC [Clostridiales bacterium]